MKSTDKTLKQLYFERDIFIDYGLDVPQELTDMITEKEIEQQREEFEKEWYFENCVTI